MYSKISDPFPKRSDNPSIKVRKTGGNLDKIKKELVTTTDTVVKEGNINMGKEPNLAKEAINPPTEKKLEYLHSQQNREITSTQQNS